MSSTCRRLVIILTLKMAAKDEVIVQLEEAALIVLSPPNLVSSEKRTKAESVFHQMRQLSRPYSLCQNILETKCSSYVQFQSIITMKEALLREWFTISLEERIALKSYLLDYISKHDSLPQYIQKHISVLLTVIIKRGVLEPERGPTVLNSYLTDISHFFNDSLKIELGCSLLSVLLVEFSSSSGSSAIGMPIEFHVKCKKVLEENGGLLLIFTEAVQTLDRYMRTGLEDTKCITALLSLSLDVLSWDFRSTYFYRSQHLLSSINHVPFKPPSSFRNVILNTAILNLFIQIFSGNSSSCNDILRISSQCLTQLASLSGPVLPSKDDILLYLTAFLQSFIPSLTNSDSYSNDMIYGIVSILRQLVTTFSCHCFSLLSVDILQAFVKMLTECHQLCSQRIVLLEREQEEEQLLLVEESHCFILEIIVRLVEGNKTIMKHTLKDTLHRILSTYLSSKLNTPYGSKAYQTGSTLDIALDDDDRVLYGDELSYIGTISRYIPENSIVMLIDLLRRCYSRCLELCQSLLLTPHNTTTVNELESLYEDIHWIMLIATYTLTDVVESEMSYIPDELLEFSAQYVSCPSLSSKDLVFSSDITSLLPVIDPIVLLVLSVCHWCLIERQLIEKGMKELVSPQVCETATWSMCTLFTTYLISLSKYHQMSPILSQLIVNNSDDSRWLLSFVFDKISYNSTVWFAEEKLMLTSVKSFAKLTRTNKTRASCLCGNESLWIFMRSFTSGQHPLSSSLQKETIAALMSCASGENKELFIKELLDPLCYRFHTQVNSLTKKDSTEEGLLLLLLESLDGVVTATHNTLIDIIFPVLCPILSTCVQLMEIFHSSSQEVSLAVLRLFCHAADNYTVFLNDNDVNKLYQICLQLIGMYSKYHIGKYSNKVIADEDQCEDLTFIIQTLSHLTTKDYIDFGSENPSNPTVSPIQVVLTGLSVVLPVINEDILKFPDLCKKFYELLHYICEIFPDSFCSTLPQELLHHSFKLIDLGCIKFNSDITLLCVECIEAISKETPTSNGDILINYMQYFLKQLLLRILNHYFESDLFSSFSAAIYQLMCSLKEHDIDLNTVLLTDNNTDVMTSLLTTTGNILTGSREHKKQFKTCLMELFPHLRNSKQWQHFCS